MSDEPKQDDAKPGPGTNADGGNWYGLVGIGLEFVVTIAVLGAIGWFADRKLNTLPWLTLVGIVIGFAVGLTMMIRAAKDAFKN